MKFDDWIRKLEDHGSAEDPVFHNGKETTPMQISYDHHALDSVAGIKIAYYGGDPLRLIRGTARGMLRERARKYRTPELRKYTA